MGLKYGNLCGVVIDLWYEMSNPDDGGTRNWGRHTGM